MKRKRLNFASMHRYIWLIVMLPLANAFGQEGENDYVVSLAGDTLRGKVHLSIAGPSEQLVVQGENEKNVYPITQIRSARMDNAEYKPIHYHDRYTLMRIDKEGYLSKCMYRSDPNSPVFDSYYLARADGTGTEVPNLGFRKYLGEFLSDCPSVSQRLQDKEFSRNDLDQVIDAYNACIQLKTDIKFQSAPGKDKLGDLDKFANTLQQADYFEGKNDAIDILNEIRSKISAGNEVPGFLLKSMQTALHSQPKMLDQFLTIIQQ